MSCANIMRKDPVTVDCNESVGKAIDILLERRIRSIPVLEGGKFLGMFSLHSLFGQLLPKAATVSAGLTDLAFVTDMVDELKERSTNLRAMRVGDVIDREVPVGHPDMSLMETVLLFYRSGENLPVVDKVSGNLVGIISPWEILACLENTHVG